MLTDEQIRDYADMYARRFEYINVEYIKKIGQHIKELGTLTPSDVHRLRQMAKTGANIKKINQMIQMECNRTTKDLSKLYEKLLKEEYTYAKELYIYSKGVQIPLKLNKQLQKHIKSIEKLTQGTFENLSKTTVIAKEYRDIIDEAVKGVSSGVVDYEKMVKDVIKKHPVGAKVVYESGNRRRLDSAVRMNVADGIRQHYMGIRLIEGEQFDADGVEISAHALCAHDHIPIQGQQYALGTGREVDGIIYDSFEELNDGLVRRIGECNCKHYITPIILGISSRAYTDEELKKYRDYSEKNIRIDGITRGRYDWSQEMRKIETKIRKEKEQVIFNREAGFADLQKLHEKRIKELKLKYQEISKNVGIAGRSEKMFVPGYR